MKRLLFGIGAFSLVLGYLVGASNTPVVGAIITGILALGASIWSLYKNKGDENQKNVPIDLRILGSILTIFSFCLLLGVFTGESYRRGWFIKEDKAFPWAGSEPPSSAYEALDWLMVAEKLRALDYDNKKTIELYKMIKSDTSTALPFHYDSKRPYHMMLSNGVLINESKLNPFGPKEGSGGPINF